MEFVFKLNRCNTSCVQKVKYFDENLIVDFETYETEIQYRVMKF